MIEEWIQECQQNHPQCQQLITPVLPTRVIDVGGGGRDPCLVHSQGRAGQYLALSHRWGDPASHVTKLVTTKENISQHCQRIPMSKIPATFRDAIIVARCLRIPYVWIDSLCIVQNDRNDWNAESSRMGDVYENAFATLFAERSRHCADGLASTGRDLDTARERFQTFQFQQDGSPGTSHEVFVSTKLRTYPNSLRAAFCLFGETRSYLETRGWILQEEILSRRKICFSATELHWQCKQIKICDCGLRATVLKGMRDVPNFTAGLLNNVSWDDQVTKRTLSARDYGDSRLSMNSDKSWRKLVEAYTRRELSFDTDRLAALAGIVSKMSKSMGDADTHYLAGIWRAHAPSHLLWRASTSSGALPCRRQRSGFAPSFSWASVTGSVSFLSTKGLDGPNFPQPSVPLEVLPAHLTSLSGSDACLFVRSKALRAIAYKRRKTDDATHDHQGNNAYEVGFCVLNPGNQLLPFQQLLLDTPEDWEYFTEDQDREFLFLVTHIVPAFSFFRHPKGLLLREVARGRYERVCLVPEVPFDYKWETIGEWAFDVEIHLV